MSKRRINDAVNWYMSELTSRVVAEFGIPSDRFHLGKIILRSLKDYPDAILQIDGATGESETNRSVLEKSIKCAKCFRNFGLTVGDAIVLIPPNHLSLCIPFYAGLFTGTIVAPIDKSYGIHELQGLLNLIKPKIIFCQNEKAPDMQIAITGIQLNATIVTFDKGEDFCDFEEFNRKYEDDKPLEEFKATDFDAETTTVSITCTSGTSGLPKAVQFTHKNFAISILLYWIRFSTFPSPTKMVMMTFPLNWMVAVNLFIGTPIFKVTRLQSSIPMTPEYTSSLIKTYKPTYFLLTPAFLMTLIKDKERSVCDFTCIDVLYIGGGPGSKPLVEYLKIISPGTEILHGYGMTEVAGIALQGDPNNTESCGKMTGCFQYRIVDIETSKDINEPNVPGELWLKGPTIFKGYYNNGETEKVFTDDGWFKTGDIIYRDDDWNFYFVERLRMIMKYRDIKMSPIEIENVIKRHHGVDDVVVTSVADPEGEDLPVACVIKKDGFNVTADEIKKLVKESLCDAKQVRGGVIFMNSFPKTESTKLDRKKIKELARTLERL